MTNVIGVDIGGTRFRVGLFGQEGHRLSVLEGDTDRSGGRDWMLVQVRERARALVAETDAPVRACGVSFGGPVDYEHQRVTSIHSPGWDSFEIVKWVRETLGLPCRVDNDANAGALGEYRFGAGRACPSMVYITLSTGVGSGLIFGGQLIRGRDNLAGELGHITVSDSGAICSCGGHGCLETFCSGSAIAARGREWAIRRPERVERVLELSGGKPELISAKAILQAAAEGDQAAAQILQEVARWLARALIIVIRLINPDRIILGGGVAQAGDVFLDPVRESLQALASPTVGYTTEVVLAELGQYSPLYGAAALAMDLV